MPIRRKRLTGQAALDAIARADSPEDVLQLFDRTESRESISGDDERAHAAAHAMTLAARAHHGSYRGDALRALDALARLKADLDAAAAHMPPVIYVTGDILLAAQEYAEEATVPCTEWPTPEDIAEVVQRKAEQLREQRRKETQEERPMRKESADERVMLERYGLSEQPCQMKCGRQALRGKPSCVVHTPIDTDIRLAYT